MKLSQVGLDLLLETPPKDKMSFILDDISDAGDSCEYALLLGAPLDKALKNSRCQNTIPSIELIKMQYELNL